MIDFSLEEYGAINDEIKLIIQQIDILFETSPNEVFGSEDFGTQYDRYLHELNISNEGLRQEVLSDINSLELFGFEPEVEVYLLQGSERDIAVVNIILSRDTDVYTKTYKIS